MLPENFPIDLVEKYERLRMMSSEERESGESLLQQQKNRPSHDGIDSISAELPR